MQEPEKPLATDCCGSGCVRCVYDIYVDQLRQYREWKKQEAANETAKSESP